MANENSELINWFKKAVGTEQCSVELQGTKEKGDGFIADIVFAKVILDEPNQNNKELNLAAKVSKRTPFMRSHTADYCQREVVFYKEIVPIFKQFQQEKNIKEPFEALPKCYKTFETENTEVLILENMISRGYELHDKRQPMNMNHIKLTLRNYAKFHAISLAISDQKPDVFKKIEETCYNMLPEKIKLFDEVYRAGKVKAIKNLNEVGRKDLAERYEKLVERESINILLDLYKDIPKEKVLTHADCHNGNFLFEYKDGNKENPSNMVLLDFQVSFVFSPVIDLSIYLYAGASKKELEHFNELMEFYHGELSSFLSQLGSDVNKLFPISTMWKHWRKYSFHGFNMATSLLELLFVDKDDIPDFDSSEQNMKDFLQMNLKDSEYLERLVAIVEHYLNFNNRY